jgi:competence protein ComEC
MRGWGTRSGTRAAGMRLPSGVLHATATLGAALAAERDRWLLWLPAALGLGIAVYFELPFEPSPWLGVALGLLGAALLMQPGATRAFGVAAIAVAIGFALCGWRAASLAAPVLAQPYGPAPVEGRVVEIMRLPEGRRVVLDQVRLRDVATAETPVRVRINITRPGETVRIGDRIQLIAALNPPPGPAAPGAFDFQRMAWFQRLGAVGFAVRGASVIGHEEPGGGLMRIDHLRERLTERIAAALPGTIGGTAAALLTGEQTAIDRDTMQAMRDSGLAHLLSISGLHIAFVLAIVMGLVRYGLALVPWIALRWPVKKIAAAAALAAAFFYMLLAGAPVPAQRAFLMGGLVLLAILLDRTALTMRLVAWAAAVVLLLEPESLLSASFQMSFAAVVALIAAWESSRGWRAAMRERFMGIEQSVPARIGLYLGGVLFTTLVAGTATAAFSAYHFNRVSLLGVVANLVAVPLTGIWVMPFGVLAMLLMPFGLEGLALAPMGYGIEATIWVARTVAGWPGASTGVASMPGISLWLLTIGGLWLSVWQRRWRLLGIAPVLAAFALAWTVAVPDLLVSENGRLVGVRAADGRLMLSGRGERFTAETWLRRNGLAEGNTWPRNGASADGSLRCETGVCTYRRGLWRVSIVRSEAAVASECRRPDVLISTVPVRERCAEPRLLLERTDFWREGAHTLRFLPTGVEMQTVRSARGDRPWVPRRGSATPFER